MIQQADQRMSRVRRRYGARNDFLGGDFLAVERLVGIAVRVHRGAFERDAGEKTLGTRVGEHVNFHGIGVVALGLRAGGTSSSGGVAAEFGLAIQNLLDAFVAHNYEHKIGGCRTELDAEAALIERVHSRSAPRTIHIGTLAANQFTAAVTTANADGYFFDAGENEHALGVIEDGGGQALVT